MRECVRVCVRECVCACVSACERACGAFGAVRAVPACDFLRKHIQANLPSCRTPIRPRAYPTRIHSMLTFDRCSVCARTRGRGRRLRWSGPRRLATRPPRAARPRTPERRTRTRTRTRTRNMHGRGR
eukprot:3951974-Pleurochrysis_carterae.AAC.1